MDLQKLNLIELTDQEAQKIEGGNIPNLDQILPIASDIYSVGKNIYSVGKDIYNLWKKTR